jgi:hypothetical protein
MKLIPNDGNNRCARQDWARQRPGAVWGQECLLA